MMRFIVALSVTLTWTVLAAVPAMAADKVVLMLNWYVYGEHAPFYYGKAKGIFAAENIDLEIQEGRGSAATTQAVAAKTANFGYVDVPTMMRAAVRARRSSPPGVLLQTSPMSAWVLSRRTSRSPRHQGQTVAITPADSMTQIWPLFLKKTGLKEGDFTTVAGDGQTQVERRHQRAGGSAARLRHGPVDENQGRHRQGRLPDQVCRLRHQHGEFGDHRQYGLRQGERRFGKTFHVGDHQGRRNPPRRTPRQRRSRSSMPTRRAARSTH